MAADAPRFKTIGASSEAIGIGHRSARRRDERQNDQQQRSTAP